IKSWYSNSGRSPIKAGLVYVCYWSRSIILVYSAAANANYGAWEANGGGENDLLNCLNDLFFLLQPAWAL
ncbi:hypothetical protein LDENG_00293810, partial [Lucifuga dentata]